MSKPMPIRRPPAEEEVTLSAWAQGALALLVPAFHQIDPETDRQRRHLLGIAIRNIVAVGSTSGPE